MKKIFTFILLLVFACSAMATLSTPKDPGVFKPNSTVQEKARLVATVTADAAALDPNKSGWGNCKTFFVEIPPQWSTITFSFYGYGNGTGAGDPNNATFSYDIHLIDLYSGAITTSVGNSGVIGAQKLTHNPVTGATLNNGDPNSSYCWADTITPATPKGNWVFSYYDYQGNNGKAEVSLDRRCAYGVWVRIYNMTDQPVTSITCVMNGY